MIVIDVALPLLPLSNSIKPYNDRLIHYSNNFQINFSYLNNKLLFFSPGKHFRRLMLLRYRTLGKMVRLRSEHLICLMKARSLM